MFRSVLCIKWNGIFSDAPNKSLPDDKLKNKCDKIFLTSQSWEKNKRFSEQAAALVALEYVNDKV